MESVVKALGATSAGSVAIPSGCYLREIIYEEKAGQKVLGGIRFGASEGANDIVASFNIEAGEGDRITIDGLRKPSIIYFDAVTDWNGAEVDISFVLGSLG